MKINFAIYFKVFVNLYGAWNHTLWIFVLMVSFKIGKLSPPITNRILYILSSVLENRALEENKSGVRPEITIVDHNFEE